MKKVAPLLSTLLLTACGSVAIMDKSDAVKAQPELVIKTDGDFWGLGQEGHFDLAGLYTGKYSRNSSGSTWFNTVSFKEGEMAAEIVRADNQKSWQLVCSGGGMSINYLGVDFGGNDPYTCSISQNNTVVGEFNLAAKSEAISLSVEKKEAGTIRIGSTHYNVETVHTGDNLMMALEHPLGYSFKQGTQEVAATQTNGMLTLQMLPNLTEEQKDVLVVGTIASALSWRPQD